MLIYLSKRGWAWLGAWQMMAFSQKLVAFWFIYLGFIGYLFLAREVGFLFKVVAWNFLLSYI